MTEAIFVEYPRRRPARLKPFLWRLACRLSNRCVTVDHVVHSGRRAHLVAAYRNGAECPDAYAMLSLLGWGCFLCHRRDRLTNQVLINSRTDRPQTTIRFGRVRLVRRH